MPDPDVKPAVQFLATTAAWGTVLTAIVLLHDVVALASDRRPGVLLWMALALPGVLGLLLPFCTFAGGSSVYTHIRPRLVVLLGLLIGVFAYSLLAFGAPIADYHTRVRLGADVEKEYPFGPDTPGSLRAQRSAVEADPPSSYSFSPDRPLQHPPNWLTYLLHSLVSLSAFAVLAALLGQQAAFLTTGLSPPARRNVRWAIGLATGILFFIAVAGAGNWVRASPAHSGLVGAYGPLAVPLVELALLAFLGRSRGGRLHALRHLSV